MSSVDTAIGTGTERFEPDAEFAPDQVASQVLEVRG